MNTFLSDAEEALKKEFERFAQDKLAPIASALADRKQSLTGFLKQMTEAGYMGLNVPAELGGKNSPFLSLILLAESLAYYEVGVVVSFAYHVACIELIKQYGSDEQKSNYLPKLASGALLGTVAHLQQQEKMLVVLSEFPLTVPLIIAVTGDDFFFLLDHNQVKITPRSVSMGLCSVCFADLDITNFCRGEAPIGAVMGGASPAPTGLPGDTASTGSGLCKPRPYNEVGSMAGLPKLSFARNIIKTMLAAGAVGMSQSVLDQSVAYTKVAQRGGQPMTESEAIQWKLADLGVESSAARLLVYRAAWSKDNENQHFSQYAAMGKAFASRVARFHSGEAMQVLLPLLEDNNSSLPRFYLDGKMLETFEATNEEEKVLLSELIGIK